MIHGPSSPDVLYTPPLKRERTVQWIDKCVEYRRTNNLGLTDATDQASAQWDKEINQMANQTLCPLTNSWYVGAIILGKPRQFLANARASQYFNRLCEVAEAGYEGFDFESVRETGKVQA